MTTLSLQPYDPPIHRREVYGLWIRTLGRSWPLAPATFHHVTSGSPAYKPGDHQVARSGQRIIGFVGTQVRHVSGETSPRGSILLIMIDPSYQRQGIGRALLDQAVTRLWRKGVTRAQLGGGGSVYFWPGVPGNLLGTWPFFHACDWAEGEQSLDLVADLKGYRTPSEIIERIRLPNVTIGTAEPSETANVLSFEEEHFPQWSHYYRQVLAHGGNGDVVVARHPEHGIVGTSCAEYPGAQGEKCGLVWEEMLGKNTGSVGPLGVAEKVRGCGIGLALAARVTELLHERGIARSFVGWTWLVDWYGRLGYRVWQDYRMGWKQL